MNINPSASTSDKASPATLAQLYIIECSAYRRYDRLQYPCLAASSAEERTAAWRRYEAARDASLAAGATWVASYSDWGSERILASLA